ncbi:MAG: methyl-accepting chemotaxis protein [Desulfomonilaceae bacterium]|nr:methyl-accepting chemotaxis protein [Syntrophaceae bacterium]
MIKFFARSLLAKMIGLFLAVSLIPIALVGTLSYWSAMSAFQKIQYTNLEEAADVRKSQILAYLDQTMMDVKFLSSLETVLNSSNQLRSAVVEKPGSTPSGPPDMRNDDYSNACKDLNPIFKRFMEVLGNESSGYDDIYIVDGVSGVVLYSFKRRGELGTSLKNGPLRESGLAKVWDLVSRTRKPSTLDFSAFAPSGVPEMFMAAPYGPDTAGNPNFMMIIGINPNRIIKIMKTAIGVGETGETRLVGQDHIMRSETRSGSESAFFRKKDEMKPSAMALKGESGGVIGQDITGEPSLVFYMPAGISKDENLGANFEWAIISDIDVKEAQASTVDLVWHIAFIALTIAVIVAILGFLAARGVSKPIRRMSDQASRISDGDLTIEVTIESRKDEIGQLTRSFHSMVENLRQQTREILDGVNILMSSSTEISATTSELAASASETSSAVSETTTTVEELKQTVNLSSEKAKSVSDRSQMTFQVAQGGKRATEETVSRMNLIKGQMESIGETVVRLSEQSLSIEEIIAAVKDLAEQSKLLAVNASIEAARAGEQGKGFAVVAQEIKSLADQSKQATDQVRTILEDIRASISAVVMATEQGNKAVDAGSKQSREAGTAIDEVTKSVHEAAQALTVVVASSEQQSVGVEQVSSAMDSIDQAMRQNVEGTRQLETAARNLEQLGQRLKDFVNRFKV